ncbi:MAG TPA: 50S ribosomal protein L23 [Thermotogota bacterium]|nr:50S ribosomal protein L23 [Thermotogota bacterium]HRW91374.1 50S ribosomal protein L23 [Thermotogota bacterium]
MAVKLTASDVLIRPIITEKTTFNMSDRKYTFEVNRFANKYMIRNAIEELYSVKVEKVSVMNVKGKPKRRGVLQGKTRSWKKAMIKLQKGFSIPELDNLH